MCVNEYSVLHRFGKINFPTVDRARVNFRYSHSFLKKCSSLQKVVTDCSKIIISLPKSKSVMEIRRDVKIYSVFHRLRQDKFDILWFFFKLKPIFVNLEGSSLQKSSILIQKKSSRYNYPNSVKQAVYKRKRKGEERGSILAKGGGVMIKINREKKREPGCRKISWKELKENF